MSKVEPLNTEEHFGTSTKCPLLRSCSLLGGCTYYHSCTKNLKFGDQMCCPLLRGFYIVSFI